LPLAVFFLVLIVEVPAIALAVTLTYKSDKVPADLKRSCLFASVVLSVENPPKWQYAVVLAVVAAPLQAPKYVLTKLKSPFQHRIYCLEMFV